MARYDFKWLARGWTGGRWGRVVAGGNNNLILAGDQIEFQNGFGNFVRHKYVCTFTPATGQAEALVEPGRF